MPLDSLLLSIAVCGTFLLFAAVLAWTDHHTTRWQRDKSRSGSLNAPQANPIDKKAA
jgi:hypothetical protein